MISQGDFGINWRGPAAVGSSPEPYANNPASAERDEAQSARTQDRRTSVGSSVELQAAVHVDDLAGDETSKR